MRLQGETCAARYDRIEFVIAVGMLWVALLASELTTGLSLFRGQRFSEAEQEFRRVLTAQPSNDQARLWLARTLTELKRVPEALGEIERVLAGSPSPDTRFQAGRILRDLAERRFRELESAAPESAAVREFAGARFERSGDLEAALREYRAAATMDRRRPGVHYRAGSVLWRMRELAAAQEELEKELAINPHHPMANLRLAQILIARDEHAQAVPYLDRCIAGMPEWIEARKELGKAYAKTGRLRDAQREWEWIAKARPEDEQIHYLLGNLYRELGDGERARRELARHREILDRRRARAGRP